MATKETRQQASLLDAAKEETVATVTTSTTATSTKTKQITATSTKSQKPAAPATGITKEQYTLAINTLKAENQKRLEDLKVKNQKELEESKIKAQKEAEALKAKQTKELEDLARRQEASMLDQSKRTKEIEELKITQEKSLKELERKNNEERNKNEQEQKEQEQRLTKQLAFELNELKDKQNESSKTLLTKFSELTKNLGEKLSLNRESNTAKATSKTSDKSDEVAFTLGISGGKPDFGLNVKGSTQEVISNIGTIAESFLTSKMTIGATIGAGVVTAVCTILSGGLCAPMAPVIIGVAVGSITPGLSSLIWNKMIDLESKFVGLFFNKNKTTSKVASNANPSINENSINQKLTQDTEESISEKQIEQPLILDIASNNEIVESYEPTSKAGDEIKNLGQNQLMLISIGISTDPETINSDFSVFQFENPHDHSIDSSTFGINFKFVGFPGMPSSYYPVKQSDYVIEPHTRSRPFVFLEGYFGNENFN